MRSTGLVAAALVLAVAAGCNKGASNASSSAGSTGSAVGTTGTSANALSGSDRDFVRDIITRNAAEIELGKLAGEKSPSSDVKQFAQEMVGEHNSAADKVQSFAVQHAVEAPTELDDRHRDAREKLAGKQGLDFDKAYADTMVDEHEALLDKLESHIDKDALSRAKTEAKNSGAAKIDAAAVIPEKSDDPNRFAVNQLAADLYPTVYAHLEAAKTLRDAVKKRATD